jgi:acyl dehydratase
MRAGSDAVLRNGRDPLAAGERFAGARSVTQADIDAYAQASGDHNPLHIDPAFAVATPLGGTVAHGMLVVAWLSALLTEGLGERWTSRGSLRIRFRAPARPGDRLALSATVRSVEDTLTGRWATLDVLVSNQLQEAVLDGTATVPVAENPAADASAARD